MSNSELNGPNRLRVLPVSCYDPELSWDQYILIAEEPPQLLPFRKRGFCLCCCSPLGQWGPRAFNNGSHVRANLLCCGFVGQIPGNGDWLGFLARLQFPECGEKAGKKKKKRRRETGKRRRRSTSVCLREDRRLRALRKFQLREQSRLN